VLVFSTDRPIVGIFTEPVQQSSCISTWKSIHPQSKESSFGSCFDSVYVKWLEQAGARVAVIPYDAPKETLQQLFSSINGLLFTGGELTLLLDDTYVENAQFLYTLALQAVDRGDYFPIWGTCQGFQLLNILTAQNISVLEVGAFDSDGFSWPLNMTSSANTSRMFGSKLPSKLWDIFTTMNVTVNLHVSGVKPQTYNENTKLNQFYSVLSTNYDRKGKEFISTMEAFKYPIYGVQWHPERPQFQWIEGIGINHFVEAIATMQYVADFFIQETRKSNHSFPTQQAEDNALIYGFNPVYTGDSVQFYFFPPSNETRKITA